MFELHDALLYAMSICTLVSLAYLCLLWVPAAAGVSWMNLREADFRQAEPHLPQGTVQTRRQRLTRLAKRKEAPDDDSSPCTSLLMTNEHNQQGGFICTTYTLKSEYSITILSRLSLG